MLPEFLNQVGVNHLDSPKVMVVSIPQRDLFKKYGHPGKVTIIDALKMFKEDLDNK
jgi:hypothetical protein